MKCLIYNIVFATLIIYAGAEPIKRQQIQDAVTEPGLGIPPQSTGDPIIDPTTPPPAPNTTTTSKPTTTTTPTTTTAPNSTTTSTTQPTTTTTQKTTPQPTTPPPSPPTTTPTTSTTAKPTAAPTAKPEPDRKFDGPSFIGGMILTMGLMAIAFVSWKFYKARTERNYHTL